MRWLPSCLRRCVQGLFLWQCVQMFVFLAERGEISKKRKRLFVFAVCILHNKLRRFAEQEAVRLNPAYAEMRAHFLRTLAAVDAEIDAKPGKVPYEHSDISSPKDLVLAGEAVRSYLRNLLFPRS